MPWFSRVMAIVVVASLPAPSCTRPRACAWSFRAVKGERSSWAALATNDFCASNAACTRPNSKLSSCTSGRTSSGRPASDSGERSSASRAATCWRVRSSGASERRMAHHRISISSGAISAMGSMARTASARALAWRAPMSCAIWMVWYGVCTEYTRKRAPSSTTSEKPSTARGGMAPRDERNSCTPSGPQIWMT